MPVWEPPVVCVAQAVQRDDGFTQGRLELASGGLSCLSFEPDSLRLLFDSWYLAVCSRRKSMAFSSCRVALMLIFLIITKALFFLSSMVAPSTASFLMTSSQSLSYVSGRFFFGVVECKVYNCPAHVLVVLLHFLLVWAVHDLSINVMHDFAHVYLLIGFDLVLVANRFSVFC